MAVLIKDRRSGRYYQSFNQWTYDPDAAFDFDNRGRAVQWIQTVDLAQVEVVRVADRHLRQLLRRLPVSAAMPDDCRL